MLVQDEVAAAQPEIDTKTAELVSKGRWNVPGYKVCRTFDKNVDRCISITANGFTGEIR